MFQKPQNQLHDRGNGESSGYSAPRVKPGLRALLKIMESREPANGWQPAQVHELPGDNAHQQSHPTDVNGQNATTDRHRRDQSRSSPPQPQVAAAEALELIRHEAALSEQRNRELHTMIQEGFASLTAGQEEHRRLSEQRELQLNRKIDEEVASLVAGREDDRRLWEQRDRLLREDSARCFDRIVADQLDNRRQSEKTGRQLREENKEGFASLIAGQKEDRRLSEQRCHKLYEGSKAGFASLIADQKRERSVSEQRDRQLYDKVKKGFASVMVVQDEERGQKAGLMAQLRLITRLLGGGNRSRSTSRSPRSSPVMVLPKIPEEGSVEEGVRGKKDTGVSKGGKVRKEEADVILGDVDRTAEGSFNSADYDATSTLKGFE